MMGGSNETILSMKDAQTVSNIRMHYVYGNVHFHDDRSGLKVSIPTHIAYRAWQDLKKQTMDEFSYVDSENLTRLRMRITKKLKVKLEITELETDLPESFITMDKFFSKRP